MTKQHIDKDENVVKKRGGCLKWALIILAVLFALSIISTLGNEDKRGDDTETRIEKNNKDTKKENNKNEDEKENKQVK